MLKDVVDLTEQGVIKGLNTQPNIFTLEKGQSPNIMDLKVNFDGSVERRLGTNTTNSVIISNSGASSFSVDSDGTLPDGVVSFWKLDEVSGTRFPILGTNNLTSVNNVTYASGIKKKSSNFISSNSQCLYSDGSLFNTGSGFTISTWFYFDSTNSGVNIVGKRTQVFAEWVVYSGLYAATGSLITFFVRSSPSDIDGTYLKASSFGVLNTATWYNAIAWWTSGANAHIGINVNGNVNTSSYLGVVYNGSSEFVLGSSESSGLLNGIDGRIDETGYWKRSLTNQQKSDLYNSGSGNSYDLSFNNYPWAAFDFGAGANRWLTVAAGTGIYASSNMGVTFVTVATDRTASYQYFERSKNILVACSDSYDVPLYWAGSTGTFSSVLNTSAPLAKFALNHQGFLILLNTSTRKRGFFYEDENSQITGDWGDSFDIPSSADDEITAAWVLKRTLYVSTRYKIYRVSYVGGNPDWSYTKIKDFGFVPRTVRNVFVKDVGEITCGMTWDRRLRLFDGTDDKIVSLQIQEDNGMSEFSMKKISFYGSGLVNSFAEYNSIEQVYKLCVPIGATSQNTTHILNFDGSQMSLYPYSNQNFNVMTMAESANQQFLIGFDRNSFCHIMNSGNLDSGVTSINGFMESNVIYEKSPSEVSKGYLMDLYFSTTSSGDLTFSHRNDFSSSFVPVKTITLTKDTSVIQHKESIDVGQTHNVYQWKIATSSNTADPWRLNRSDYFTAGKGIGRN